MIHALHLIDSVKGIHIDNIAGPENLPDPESDRALVSVIVPAYNAASFIRTSINSLRNQSWRNLEILVVDDASEDNTCEIVSETARIDPRVRLIKSEINRGDSYARNLALAQAKGDFVTLPDADDFAHPRKIEIQAEDLLQYPDIQANRSNHMRALEIGNAKIVISNENWK